MKLRSAILALPLLLLSACDIQHNKTELLTGTGMDMFGPVELRIHPLTRVVVEPAPSTKTTLEVRIELADQFGDITKGVGTVAITVSRAGTLTSHVIDRWEVSIDTPVANREHWDSITRTYLFHRELPADTDPKSVIVSATLTSPGGQTISNELRLK